MTKDQARKAVGLYVATGFNTVCVDGRTVYVRRNAKGFKVEYHTDSGLLVQRIIKI